MYSLYSLKLLRVRKAKELTQTRDCKYISKAPNAPKWGQESERKKKKY